MSPVEQFKKDIISRAKELNLKGIAYFLEKNDLGYLEHKITISFPFTDQLYYSESLKMDVLNNMALEKQSPVGVAIDLKDLK